MNQTRVSLQMFVVALSVLFLHLPPVLAQTRPAIAQDLSSQTYYLAGSNVKLSVGVSGTGPFSYQWQLNGTNLPNGIIATVAGGGNGGDNGQATNASLNTPRGVTTDGNGNLFISEYNGGRVRRVSTTGIITTIAGNGTSGYGGDGGPGPSAVLYDPWGLAVDSVGNVYIADQGNSRIRKIGTDGNITTVAGVGTNGVTLNQPSGAAVAPSGQLLIADTYNQRIREFVAPGAVIVVAGTGSAGYSGNGTPATNATMDFPYGIAADTSGNFYIVDTQNQRVRMVTFGGIITNVAGNGSYGFGGDGGAATNANLDLPYGIAVDPFGNVFIADEVNNRIRKVSTDGIISTVAGKSSAGYSGDGGPATNATLYQPYGVAADPYGNVYVADTGNSRIRRVILQGPTISANILNPAVAGNYDVVVSNAFGSVTSSVATVTVVFPAAITVQPQDQVALLGDNATFSVSATGATPLSYQWYSGGASLAGRTNAALFLGSVNSNNAGNYAVVVANPYTTVTSAVAGLTVVSPAVQAPVQPVSPGSTVNLTATVYDPEPVTYQWQFNGSNLPGSTITTVAGNGSNNYSGDGGQATNTGLDNPSGVALDPSGNLYIADTLNGRIRKVATNGIITTVAGGGNGGDGSGATSASLNYPRGVALDAYGNLFIADLNNDRIREVTYGIIFTVAGGGSGGSYYNVGDGGLAINAYLSPSGVVLDSHNNLFIADQGDNRVRLVNASGVINTVAGTGGMYGGFSGDGGSAIAAAVATPWDIALDSAGNFYIADSGNNRIRKVNANGLINTVAGGGNGGDGGLATNASLRSPHGVAVDAYGNLFIADTFNDRIRKVGINGLITTEAGTGGGGFSGDGGSAINATLNQPYGLALDSSGALYLADTFNNRIRKVIFQGQTLVLTNVSAGNAGNYDLIVTGPSGSVTTSVATFTFPLPPQNLSVQLVTGQHVQLQFTGSPNSSYVLQATTNLAPPNWQPLTTNFTDLNGNWSFIDTNVPAQPVRFYRASLP